MDVKAFEKLVKSNGCEIVFKTKHISEIRKNGVLVSTFSITHNKGSKDEVKQIYIRNFYKALALIKDWF